MGPELALVVVIAFIIVAVRFANATDQPKIKGLPEVPGLPLFGSLLELGTSHAKVAARLAEKYGPVFQARLGNRRIVFANTYDSVRTLWINNQSALISRPTLHTFHSVVSSSQGFTIGTSPWDESCKRRRKAAATALNRPAVASYMPIIDLESTTSIRELQQAARKDAARDVDPVAYFQRYALNTSLTLNYGFRIHGNVDDALLKEITDVERAVSNFRSTSNNWQDYIPLMRLWPQRNREAEEFRLRRDIYMGRLLNQLKDEIKGGVDKPCISGNILKDPEARLSEAEVKSICLTMVSAGLDTIPGNLIMGIAYMSSCAEGRAVQAKAHAAIEAAYPGGDAWHKAVTEEKVEYITALVKEVLRFWTVIPICLPRTSIKDIVWRGATIPAGTTFYMNAWAADYDGEHFREPERFAPERYLGDISSEGTPHYGYGAGSRMCAGSHLANRELYVAFVRLIAAFEMGECADEASRPVLDPFGCNATPTSLTMDPRHFQCSFKERNPGQLDAWIRESEALTSHL